MSTERETRQKLGQETRLKKREEKQRRKDEKVARKAAKQEAKRNRPPSVLLQEFWNLPNMLTVGRIFMIPLFVWLLYDGDPWYSVMAASVFTIAAVTDVIDGFLARRWNPLSPRARSFACTTRPTAPSRASRSRCPTSLRCRSRTR